MNRYIAGSLRRNLSAQAARKVETSTVPAQQPKVTQLPNGIVVASLENHSPITRLSVVYKAGARYEHPHAIGAAHCIRALSNLSTKNCTTFGLVKNINQIGGVLGCSTTRDHMIYNLQCLREHVDVGTEYLANVSTVPAFKPWEVSDSQPRLNYDVTIFQQQDELCLFENIHDAAFKNGLNRSLYSPSFMVGHYQPEMLQDFVSHNFTTGRMAVVGVGIDHDALVSKTKDLFNPIVGAGGPDGKGVYKGGESRVDTSSDFAQAVIATEGASLNTKEALALGVVQQILGSGSYVKYGSNTATSKLNQAAVSITNNPVVASCFNVNYSDSGLFGFFVAGQGEDMAKVVPALVKQMAAVTKSGLTEQEVARGKKQLKANVAMSLDNDAQLVEEMSIQAVTQGKLTSVEEICQSINSLTTSDINNIAKKVINGKPSMASIGDLSTMPFLDELV